MSGFAIKHLAAVEIEPDASNQHELNAGRLRVALGFPEGRSEGDLRMLLCLDDESAPILLEGQFTLYNARERTPGRKEYRMYYRLPDLVNHAKVGDLLVLGRDPSSGIHGLLARPGTAVAREVGRLLDVGDHDSLRRMVIRKSSRPITRSASDWVLGLLPAVRPTELSDLAATHPLLMEALKAKEVPSTRKMAEAGRDIAASLWGEGLAPDDFILRGLESESALYFAIEDRLGNESLARVLAEGGADLDGILAWAMRLQQSRRSRRGQSLQHHFGFLLDREGTPYTPQGRTEGNRRPDFLIPGEAEYQDPTYPATRLRMVACKSTVRERWRQILKEADRVPEKFLLTVDETLTAEVLANMRNDGLRVFVPEPLIRDQYYSNPAAYMIGTVNELLQSLI